MRLIQGANYTVGSCNVGVMNIYREPRQPGAVIAHLSVYDRRTSSDRDVVVRAGDDLTVGSERYTVVEVVPAASGERAWMVIRSRRT